jgi:serine/threonine protein kinase
VGILLLTLWSIMSCDVVQYVNYLSWKRRLMMLHDVASGMLFMHSRRYVHGDLRSPNLFITENGKVSGYILLRVCVEVCTACLQPKAVHKRAARALVSNYCCLLVDTGWRASKGAARQEPIVTLKSH